MVADAYTWPLSEIRTRFREHTGRSTTGEMSDAECNKRINDYYVNFFAEDAKVPELFDWLTQALSATDSGYYTLAQAIAKLIEPVTINNTQIMLQRDATKFFEDYPDDEQFVTAPTLVIGTSATTKVKHSAFTYDILGYTYSKTSSEVVLTGSAIPLGKYGAWSLKIDDAGTITVTAASGNATGYDTPTLALEALAVADNDSAYMGYVTVTKSDGVFTPAITVLSASNVTATYTDGKFQNRGDPEAACVYNGKLYVRPKADDILQFKAPVYKRPTAFAVDADMPADMRWGPMIAAGAAILYLQSIGSEEKAANIFKVFAYYQGIITGKKLIQQSRRYAESGI